MSKLSIVVPYRDREEHLLKFIPTLENSEYLKELDFEILIVEQDSKKPFNRGKLLNIGFSESKESDYFCFHDVDMLPLVSDYSRVFNPTHLAAEAEQFEFKLPYNGYFGGVTLFDRNSFQIVNGFSNDYWGWGAEDDDILFRCKVLGIKTSRKKGRYQSLKHEKNIQKDLYNENLRKFFGFRDSINLDDIFKKIKSDGLSNLDYQSISAEKISETSRKIKVKI
jgi:predicted glycosyltransferase involved in capsule biosynthesis